MRLIGWTSLMLGTLWGCLNSAAWTILGGPGGEVEHRMFQVDVYTVVLLLAFGGLVLATHPRGTR